MSTAGTLAADGSHLLRLSMRISAAFSGISGVALIAAGAPLAALMGIAAAAALPPIGTILLVYAGGLWWSARRPSVRRSEAKIAVSLDAAWIVLSVAYLLAAPSLLAPAGNWIVAAVAACVAALAILQALGLRALDRV